MSARSNFAISILLSAGMFAAAAACGGGDDSSGDDSTTDAGGTDVTTSDVATINPQANANDVSVYIGQVATLDGSASTPSGLTFTWTVTSAPAGSTVTTASLQNANAATATFAPDVVGDYALKLAVATEGVTSSKDIAVHAASGKAFFGHAENFPDGGATSDIRFTRIDGTGPAVVSCDGHIGAIFGYYVEGSGIDWIEGAAADDSRVAFSFVAAEPDAAAFTYLGAGTAASRCGTNPPAQLDYFGPDADLNAPPRSPRLSPDGSRIAYFRGENGSGFVTTIGFDGSGLREIGPIAPLGDGGVGPTPGSVPPARWIDATHVAWVELTSTTSWSLVSAADAVSPSVTTLMTCNAATINPGFGVAQAGVLEFDLLPDGTVLAAVAGAADASTNLNLVVLKPNASTKECEIVRSITSYADGTSSGTDFALSPDKSTVAFLANIGAGGTLLYTAPVDGSSPPSIVPGTTDGGAIGFGPRWAAAGTALVLSQGGALRDGGSPNNLVSIAPDGGRGTVAASGDSTEFFFASGNSCSIALGQASPFAAVGFFGVFVGLFVRRSRRRSR